jgi:hypothetical protein
VDEDIASVISDHFWAGCRPDDPDQGRAVDGLIHSALREIPTPDAWMVVPSGASPDPKALLLIGDRLVEIWIGRNDDAEYSLQFESRPLTNSGIVVGLESYDPRVYDGKADHKTKWSFKFSDGKSIRIHGGIQTKPDVALSAEEEFARAVSERVGQILGKAEV